MTSLVGELVCWMTALMVVTASNAHADDKAELQALKEKLAALEMNGWYFEAGYDILPYLVRVTRQALSPFVRYESLCSEVLRTFECVSSLPENGIVTPYYGSSFSSFSSTDSPFG